MAGEAPIEHDSSWPVVSLAEIAIKIGSGATPKGGADAYIPTRERYALVRSQNVFDRRFDYSGLAFITDKQAEGLRSVVLQPDDILLNITGDGITFGRACMVPNEVLPACVNQHVSIIRVDSRRADAGYVLGFLTHPTVKSYIESFNAGGSRRAITKGHIESFRLPLPPLAHQRAIAHMLGTLDDKIELNRKMNQTLEAMARALFKSWFVDFDPVRAKAESRDTGLPKHIADLFPDSFEDSELGEIPKGWRVCFIRDLTRNVQYGFTHSASSDPIGPRFLRITDIQGGKVDWPTVPFCEVTPQEHERYRLKPGDVLVARTGASTGENIYLSYAPDAVFASYLVRFQFSDTANARLVGAFMRTQSYFEYVTGGIGGSAQPNASAQVLAGARLVVPTPSIARVFFDLVMPLDLSVVANTHESRTLTDLRDTLLPKLISGELSVRSAKQYIERAV